MLFRILRKFDLHFTTLNTYLCLEHRVSCAEEMFKLQSGHCRCQPPYVSSDRAYQPAAEMDGLSQPLCAVDTGGTRPDLPPNNHLYRDRRRREEARLTLITRYKLLPPAFVSSDPPAAHTIIPPTSSIYEWTQPNIYMCHRQLTLSPN